MRIGLVRQMSRARATEECTALKVPVTLSRCYRHYVAQEKTVCNGDVYLERRTNPHWMHLTRDLVEFDAILWNGGEHALGENR